MKLGRLAEAVSSLMKQIVGISSSVVLNTREIVDKNQPNPLPWGNSHSSETLMGLQCL